MDEPDEGRSGDGADASTRGEGTCSPSQRTYRPVALGALALIQRMLPLVHCLLEYRHGLKDRSRQGSKPEGPRPEGAWFTRARSSPRIFFGPNQKTKGRNQNFSGTRNTPGGIETSLPSAPVLETMTTLLDTCVRGYSGKYLTHFGRGATPSPPLFAGR